MITFVHAKMSAAEVRELPIGTGVILHSRDRRGRHIELECTIVPHGRRKTLQYRDERLVAHTIPIREYKGKYYTPAL